MSSSVITCNLFNVDRWRSSYHTDKASNPIYSLSTFSLNRATHRGGFMVEKYSDFFPSLENNADPLTSFKDLITSISTYTNKSFSQVADELEALIFGFEHNGPYINSFCRCTIIDKRNNEIVEPNQSHFADSLNDFKSPLKEVVAKNVINVNGLELIYVRRREISKQLKVRGLSLLEKATSIETFEDKTLSQDRNDYISIYELVEWAKQQYPSYQATADDLLRLLRDKQIQLYRHYGGIKPSIDKDNTKFIEALRFISENNSYNFNDGMPF